MPAVLAYAAEFWLSAVRPSAAVCVVLCLAHFAAMFAACFCRFPRSAVNDINLHRLMRGWVHDMRTTAIAAIA